MDRQVMIARIVGSYAVVMSVLTLLHALLSPIIYSADGDAPVLWQIHNPLNAIMLVALVVLSAIRKINYDRARAEGMGDDSVIKYFEVNFTMYALVVVTLAYAYNWLFWVNPGNWPAPFMDEGGFTLLWYLLDSVVPVMGLAIGARMLRMSGIRVIYDAEPGMSMTDPSADA